MKLTSQSRFLAAMVQRVFANLTFTGTVLLGTILLGTTPCIQAAEVADGKRLEPENHPCVDHFKTEGGFLIGPTHRTWQVFSGISQAKILDKAGAALVANGWHVNSIDREMGVLTASRVMKGGGGQRENVTMIVHETQLENTHSKALQADIVLNPAKGVLTSKKEVATTLCKALSAVDGKAFDVSSVTNSELGGLSHSTTASLQMNRYRVGLGFGTLLTGLSGKYFVTQQLAVQGLVGALMRPGGGLSLGVDGLYELGPLLKAEHFQLNGNMGFGAALLQGDYYGYPYGLVNLGAVAGIAFQFQGFPLESLLQIRPGLNLGDEDAYFITGLSKVNIGVEAAVRYCF